MPNIAPEMKGISHMIQTTRLNLWKFAFAFASFLANTTVAQSAWKSINIIASKPVMQWKFSLKPPDAILLIIVVHVVSNIKPK